MLSCRRRAEMMVLLAPLVLCFALLAAAEEAIPSPATVRLTVRITGLRNERGLITVALFRGKEGFPDNDAKAVAHANIPATNEKNGAAEVDFPSLPPGEYAVSLFHDENSNHKLDTSFGFPLEGFGVSNNPKPRFGPPRWGDARFSLSPDNSHPIQSVSLRYMSR